MDSQIWGLIEELSQAKDTLDSIEQKLRDRPNVFIKTNSESITNFTNIDPGIEYWSNAERHFLEQLRRLHYERMEAFGRVVSFTASFKAIFSQPFEGHLSDVKNMLIRESGEANTQDIADVFKEMSKRVELLAQVERRKYEKKS